MKHSELFINFTFIKICNPVTVLSLWNAGTTTYPTPMAISPRSSIVAGGARVNITGRSMNLFAPLGAYFIPQDNPNLMVLRAFVDPNATWVPANTEHSRIFARVMSSEYSRKIFPEYSMNIATLIWIFANIRSGNVQRIFTKNIPRIFHEHCHTYTNRPPIRVYSQR